MIIALVIEAFIMIIMRMSIVRIAIVNNHINRLFNIIIIIMEVEIAVI